MAKKTRLEQKADRTKSKKARSILSGFLDGVGALAAVSVAHNQSLRDREVERARADERAKHLRRMASNRGGSAMEALFGDLNLGGNRAERYAAERLLEINDRLIDLGPFSFERDELLKEKKRLEKALGL